MKEGRWSIERIDEMVDLLKELEATVADYSARIDSLKDTIKKELADRCVDELLTKKYKISHKTVVSKRFDTKKFKAEKTDLYESYLKESESKRFLVR